MLKLFLLAAFVFCGHGLEEESLEDNGRVVGGTNAPHGAWPSQKEALLRRTVNLWNSLPEDVVKARTLTGFKKELDTFMEISLQYLSGGQWHHTCGGTLVRPNWVMTAAHCVDRPLTFRVVVGEHNLNQNDGSEQYLSVGSKFIHPYWNSNNVAAGYDIALLRLSQRATLNSYVQLGVLPGANEVLANNHPCYITGWGLTRTNGQLATILQQAPLPVVSYSICSGAAYWGSTVKKTMVCAGGDGVHSGCQGDSGGPLNCLVGGRYQVHGVTSFVSASGCNTYRKPTVFTRVSAYISWINNIINSN